MEEREDLLKSWVLQACVEFKFLQENEDDDDVENENPLQKAQHKKFMALVPDEDEIPINLIVDIGRFLGLRKEPDSNSWIHAGKSYVFKLFCMGLWESKNTNEPMPEEHEIAYAEGANKDNGLDDLDGNVNSDDREDAEDLAVNLGVDEAIAKWSSNSLNASMLKCYIVKEWAEKMCGEENEHKMEWNERRMLDGDITAAIEKYTAATGIKWNPQLLAEIAKSAKGTWMANIVGTAKQQIVLTIPDTPFNDAIRTLNGRQQWTAFYCKQLVVAKTKHPKTNRKRTGGTSLSAAGRAASRQKTNFQQRSSTVTIPTELTPTGPPTSAQTLMETSAQASQMERDDEIFQQLLKDNTAFQSALLNNSSALLKGFTDMQGALTTLTQQAHQTELLTRALGENMLQSSQQYRPSQYTPINSTHQYTHQQFPMQMQQFSMMQQLSPKETE